MVKDIERFGAEFKPHIFPHRDILDAQKKSKPSQPQKCANVIMIFSDCKHLRFSLFPFSEFPPSAHDPQIFSRTWIPSPAPVTHTSSVSAFCSPISPFLITVTPNSRWSEPFPDVHSIARFQFPPSKHPPHRDHATIAVVCTTHSCCSSRNPYLRVP